MALSAKLSGTPIARSVLLGDFFLEEQALVVETKISCCSKCMNKYFRFQSHLVKNLKYVVRNVQLVYEL